jgi:hypothetical protein
MWAKTLVCAWKTAPVSAGMSTCFVGRNGQQPVFNFQGHFSMILTWEGVMLTYSTVSNYLALFCVFGSHYGKNPAVIAWTLGVLSGDSARP